MKRSVRYLVVLGGLAFGLTAVTHAETSFNLSTVSLYKSRGVDQDGRDQAVRPAVQGGVDYTSSSGFYLGNWNSTGRFGDAHVEIDLYGGYKAALGKDLALDLGYIQYYYPGAGSWNSGEVYAGLSYRHLDFKIYRGMRHEVNDGDLYYLLGYTYPLATKLGLRLELGYQTYQVENLRDKTDYLVGLNYALGKTFSVSAAVAGANRRGDVTDGSHDPRIILGASAAF